MKKIFKIAAVFSFIFTLGTSGQTFASGGWDLKDVASVSLVTSTPVGFLICLNGDLDKKSCDAISTQDAGLSATTTTTALLLKDIEAAQPDALNYIAGGAPSPTLYSVVERLQDFSNEFLGKDMTFDEAVDDIINHI